MADAQSKVTWSEAEKMTVSREGLGWDGEGPALGAPWIQTKPLAMGLSWRPPNSVTVRVSIEPPPGVFTLDNEKMTIDAGDVYVRYSPDRKHWSFWQFLQRAEPQSTEEKLRPSRHYSGLIQVPNRERSEYNKLVLDYARMDVPWSSDEEAAVRWILERDPGFFVKHIPFIGYVEFLWEGQLRGGQRIRSFKADLSYGMGGLGGMPPGDDAAVHKNRDGPWRFEAGKDSKGEPGAPAKGLRLVAELSVEGGRGRPVSRLVPAGGRRTGATKNKPKYESDTISN